MTTAEQFLSTVRVNEEKPEPLYDQWLPQEVVSLADNIFCLTFTDGLSGRSAVWYIDGQHQYCGSHIEVVQRLRTEDILSVVSPWFDDLVRNSLTTSPTILPDAPPIPLFLATQLAAAWSVRTLSELRQVQTALLERDQNLVLSRDNPIPTRQIRRLLNTRIGPETLVALSPFTSMPLCSQISFLVDHQLIHRFHDPEAESTFYLAWWEHQLDQSPAFYSPKNNLIVSDDEQAALLPARILGWFLSHPDHVEVIAHAQIFEAKNYGLGNTSSLLKTTTQDNATPTQPKLEAEPVSTADMISESWAFCISILQFSLQRLRVITTERAYTLSQVPSSDDCALL